MVKLSSFLKKYKLHIIWGPFFKLIEAVFELIIPIYMANVIDIGIANRDKEYIVKMGALIVLFAIGGLTAAVGCQYLAAKASQGVGVDLRKAVFERVNCLSYRQIDTLGTSSLITRITNDVNNLQNAIAMTIRLAIRAPFLLIGSVIMSVMIDARMSIIFLIAVVVISLVLFLLITKASPMFTRRQTKLDKISLLARENLDGSRVIRAFSKQKNEINRFENAGGNLLDIDVAIAKILAFLNPLTYIVVDFSIIAILWIGAFQINSGLLLQGKILALINYMMQILMVLFIVAMLVMLFTRASAASKRIFEILNIEPDILDGDTKVITKNETVNKVEFQNVSFTYEHGEDDVLKDISITIKKNETLGIIGGTGSGKSTFINLLSRFYDVCKGKILIDGIDVKDYKVSDLREKIGIVPQKAILFSGTVEENLKMGRKDITKEDIERALKISQSYDFVSKLNGGLNFKIERDGKNLSGGQKQRLTIARALVGNPEILILDDSSSALDANTDANLRKELGKISGITVIIISQKFSSIRFADKILVLDDGKIAGLGTHEELLENCNLYKEIYNSQVG